MSMGIYKITNKVNGQSYIGLSKDIECRWRQHELRSSNPKDKEYEKALYRAFRKYGLQSFEWTILEECSEEELSDREIYWIGYYNTYANGYNETPGGDVGNINHGESHPNHKLTEVDVYTIRSYYKNLARKKDIYSLYKDRIGESGFSKIWKGETWTNIMMDIYTPERKLYHKNNTGNAGASNSRAIVTADDVKQIRFRKQAGEKCFAVMKDYPQISKGGFCDIWSGKNWKEIVV